MIKLLCNICIAQLKYTNSVIKINNSFAYCDGVAVLPVATRRVRCGANQMAALSPLVLYSSPASTLKQTSRSFVGSSQPACNS